MREFVAQRAIDLLASVFSQTRIQRDELSVAISTTGCCLKARVPLDPDERHERHCANRLQQVTSGCFELRIAPSAPRR